MIVRSYEFNTITIDIANIRRLRSRLATGKENSVHNICVMLHNLKVNGTQ